MALDDDITREIRQRANSRKAGGNRRERDARRNPTRKRSDYGTRPFIAWDSEGWSDHKGRHHTCLFGASTGEHLKGARLTTRQMLDLICRTGEAHPKAIHVGYSFGYDVNMILESLTPGQLLSLKRRNVVHWNAYRIEHIPGKWLDVARTERDHSGRRNVVGSHVRIMDVFSFFATSFVVALRKWNVGDAGSVSRIETGKDNRGTFQLSQLPDIERYWREELELLVSLCGELRRILATAGIEPKSWHGPGAVATALFRRHNTKSVLDKNLPEPVLDASSFAYAGGRFETFRAGMVDGPVYSADINSAYPYVLSTLPDLCAGTWRHVKWDTDDPARVAGDLVGARIALVRLSVAYSRTWQGEADFYGRPFPLFHRATNGSIAFPGGVTGWYHLPEVQLVLDPEVVTDAQILQFHEAWIFEDDGSSPFAWLADLYEQRLRWKRDGNPAQLAAKLGINSVYGKLAQRVGGKDDAPTWHQLEYAGAITSGARAMLYRAMASVGEDLIAGETDGVYSTTPFPALQNGTGDGLGQWGLEDYDGIFYVQSGVYWLRKGEDWLKPKSRGIPSRSLDFDTALASYGRGESLKASHTTFVGYGRALAGQFDKWRRWIETEKEFGFGGGGKRAHFACRACKAGVGLTGGLHPLFPRKTRMGTPEDVGRLSWESQPHYLPWRDTPKYPEMDARSESIKWERDGWHD